MVKKFRKKIMFEFFKRFSKNKIRNIKLKEFSLFIDFKTPGISKMLYLNGTREEDMIQLIKQHIPNFGDVIDCGSNIGFYPIMEALHTNNHQRIICIEPDDRNIAVLKQNIETHGCERHEVLHMAVSDVDGQAKLDTSRASNLNYITTNETVTESESVEVITLDNLIARHKLKPSFLRMDIEGHELNVFAGATKWAADAASNSVVFFETHAPLYPKTDSLYKALSGFRDNGFYAAALVSAGDGGKKLSEEFGLNDGTPILSDGYKRMIFEDIDFELACKLASEKPKLVRYLLLRKK